MRRGETSTHSCVRGLYRRWVSFCKSNIGRFVQTRKHYSRGESPPSRRRGGCAIKKNDPVPYSAQTGWLFQATAYQNTLGWIYGSLKQPLRPLLSSDAASPLLYFRCLLKSP